MISDHFGQATILISDNVANPVLSYQILLANGILISYNVAHPLLRYLISLAMLLFSYQIMWPILYYLIGYSWPILYLYQIMWPVLHRDIRSPWPSHHPHIRYHGQSSTILLDILGQFQTLISNHSMAYPLLSYQILLAEMLPLHQIMWPILYYDI